MALAVTLLICVCLFWGRAFTPQHFIPFASANAAQCAPVPERVVVISLDGARPDALLQADTPHIQALASRGAATWKARTVMPSATLPAHVSMLTGLSVAEHGVTWNDNVSRLPVLAPTFLTRAQQAGYQAALVVGKQKLEQLHQTLAVDFTFVRQGDRSVADRVLDLLEADYRVIFAHFPNPDFFGHLSGWMSPIYLYELTNTDRQVGRVLSKLDQLDLADDTLVVLTADHGGHDHMHGSDRPEDMLIPWIIAGPGIEAGTQLTTPIQVADTAATVLWALGLSLPESGANHTVYEAFGCSP